MRGMRSNPRVALLLIVSLPVCALALTGCDDDRHEAITQDNPGSEGDGGPRPSKPPPRPTASDDEETDEAPTDDDGEPSGSGDAGSGGGAPTVEILSPEDQDDPDEVHDESIDVSCMVSASEAAGSKGVDPATIVIELLDTDNEVISTIDAIRGDSADVYEATFPTQNVPSGRVRIRCTGGDSSAESKMASQVIDVFIDHGPEVTIVTPKEGEAESALGAVVFEYEVEADALVKGDTEAEIDTVTLSILGEKFELTESDEEPGIYRMSVDFDNDAVFKEVPSGPLLVSLSATNLRGITHSERYEFILDGEGPTISIKTPEDTQIVGGTTTISLEAIDEASEVDWETLSISLNNVSYPYEADGPWTILNDTATFTFETASVEGSTVQINVNATVKDAAGNTSPPAAVLYYRDEQPPTISMDPPNVRQIDLGWEPPQCSVSFDPLGISPPNGARVLDLQMYRALVWDETNCASGCAIRHFSGVDRESVALFARRADGPLVIDTTGDGRCDDVNQENTRFQELTALDPTGSPLFQNTPGEDTVSPALDGLCELVDRTAPEQLCEDQVSDLSVVIGHANAEDEPVVYAVSPDTSLECTGRQWELRSAGLQGYQGWVCLAVLAYDEVGNRGVSKPIAVCLDNDQVDGAPSCHVDLNEPPPDCTDGCSDPPTFSPAIIRLD